jgi:hypothetical protein
MGDPRGSALAKEVQDAQRREWRYIFLFPPLIYWLAWRLVGAPAKERPGWRIVLYLSAAVTAVVVPLSGVASGGPEALFVVLGCFLGIPISGAALGAIVKTRQPERGEQFIEEMAVLPLVMIAGAVLIAILLFVFALFFYGGPSRSLSRS